MIFVCLVLKSKILEKHFCLCYFIVLLGVFEGKKGLGG